MSDNTSTSLSASTSTNQVNPAIAGTPIPSASPDQTPTVSIPTPPGTPTPPAPPTPNPQPTTHNPQPTTHNPQPPTPNAPPSPPLSPTDNRQSNEVSPRNEAPDGSVNEVEPRKLLIPLTVFTLISLASLSAFFLANSRQPKFFGKAAVPTPKITPPISLGSQSQPQGLTDKTPGVGFGGLVSDTPPPTSDLPSVTNPQPTTENPQPTTNNQQPTTNNQQPTTAPPAPTEVPSRVTFDIIAENNTFTPNQLSARVGQIISLFVTAKDKDYDVGIPDLSIKKTFKIGQKNFIEFQAATYGQYVFLCKDNCGGDNTTAKGLLTIMP